MEETSRDLFLNMDNPIVALVIGTVTAVVSGLVLWYVKKEHDKKQEEPPVISPPLHSTTYAKYTATSKPVVENTQDRRNLYIQTIHNKLERIKDQMPLETDQEKYGSLILLAQTVEYMDAKNDLHITASMQALEIMNEYDLAYEDAEAIRNSFIDQERYEKYEQKLNSALAKIDGDVQIRPAKPLYMYNDN